MLSKYFTSIICIWLMSTTYLYNITGKSECFWFILLNIMAMSMIGICLYSCTAFIGNKILKREIEEEIKEEIDLKTNYKPSYER